MKRLSMLASAVALWGVVSAATAAPAVRIDVDATKSLGPVNRMVFGQNLEAANPNGIFSQKADLYAMCQGDGTWNDTARQPNAPGIDPAREARVSVIRYPGGCLAHNFDWKETVGPVAGRPEFRFGVDEFLQVCHAVGAVPLFTISDFRGTPKDAADLVEYLNASATPNHPWAMKRAAWGHVEPYHVKWFELGNESNHGNHNVIPHRQFTAEQYAEYALETGQAMKAVDPSIKIGIQAANGRPPDDPWNPIVYKKAGSIADFVIVHLYPVGYGSNESDVDEARLAQACMAAGEQAEDILQGHHDEIRQFLKRDLPIALTEYNIGAVQEKPHPFRFGYAEGLFSADLVRALLQPSSNILMAEYWQFWNGYWGMVTTRTPDGQFAPRPAYPLYRLWGQHFGDRLLATTTDTPRVSFAGFSNVYPANGKSQPKKAEPYRSMPFELKSGSVADNVTVTPGTDGAFKIHIANATGQRYPLFGHANRPSGLGDGTPWLRLSCEARFLPDPGSTYGAVGLGLCDTRGWDTTHSAVALDGPGDAHDWQPFSAQFRALNDMPAVDLVLRLETGAQTVSGTLEVRNAKLEVRTGRSVMPYAAVTSTASLSKDGKTMYVIVFNKSADQDYETAIDVRGFNAASARKWTVNADSLTAGVWSQPPPREVESGVSMPLAAADKLVNVFPAHSMTAIELQAK
jgi:alpha-N-arabinofuranosidase